MLKHVMGTAVAAVFATAMVGAQTTAQDTQGQRDHQASGHQQMVTVEGCLQQQDRDTTVTADAARADGDAFMLVNAQVQSGAMASSSAAGQATGTAGQAGAQTETAGTSGTATAGTTGAAADSGSKFKVTGLDDDRLKQYEGQRVKIQGHIEERGSDRSSADRAGQYGADRTGASAGATTSTEGAQAGATAGEGAAGTTGSASGATGAAAGTTAHASAASGVKELKATSIEAASGTCPSASR